jgi:hypothetical protein
MNMTTAAVRQAQMPVWLLGTKYNVACFITTIKRLESESWWCSQHNVELVVHQENGDETTK